MQTPETNGNMIPNYNYAQKLADSQGPYGARIALAYRVNEESVRLILAGLPQE
jgi:hypothetical protein